MFLFLLKVLVFSFIAVTDIQVISTLLALHTLIHMENHKKYYILLFFYLLKKIWCIKYEHRLVRLSIARYSDET